MAGDGREAATYRSGALDVRRLSLFLAVVEHGGFSKAASAVYLSQPALSQAISELENEVGGPLFHRLGRTVRLTDAGEALVGPARAALRAIDQARQATGELTGLVRGQLDVSALRTLSSDPVPELIGGFVRRYPHIRVRLASPSDPGALIEQLLSGDVEVGISAAGPLPAGLQAVPLGCQHLQALYPPGSPRPEGVVTPQHLAGVGLIVTPAGTSGRALLEGWMGAAGVEMTVAVETSQREAVVPLVLAGAGVALVPAGAAAIGSAAGAVAVAVEPAVTRELVLVHRTGALTAPAAAFVALARAAT